MSGQWPDGRDPASLELRRALNDARERGPDDMTLRRGWAAVADLVSRRPVARARRWSYFVGGVASMGALAAAFAALLWPRTIDGPARESAATVPPAAATAPETGTRFLTLDGGVQAKLSATSVMRLEGSDPRVEDGEVRFSVPHRTPGHPFVVRAERFRVVVVGTKFGVAVNGTVGDGKTVAIDVDEGIVEIWGEGKVGRLARLSRGDSWRSPEAAPAEPKTEEPTNEEPAKADEATLATSIGGSKRASIEHHRRGGAARTVALAGPGGEGTHPAVSAEAPAAGGSNPTSAARALASGDASRALQMYRALAQRSGPAAQNAAYEIGKILNERMGQPAGAVAAWRRYRSDYPSGNLRVEADVSIIETLARTGDTDEALGEATDFLRRHPDSERRGEIARVAGDLYRARGDYRRAVSAYQIAINAARTREVTEAATFHRAACLVRLGDSSGVDAARAYLRAFPSGRFKTEAAALVAGDGRSP